MSGGRHGQANRRADNFVLLHVDGTVRERQLLHSTSGEYSGDVFIGDGVRKTGVSRVIPGHILQMGPSSGHFLGLETLKGTCPLSCRSGPRLVRPSRRSRLFPRTPAGRRDEQDLTSAAAPPQCDGMPTQGDCRVPFDDGGRHGRRNAAPRPDFLGLTIYRIRYTLHVVGEGRANGENAPSGSGRTDLQTARLAAR